MKTLRWTNHWLQGSPSFCQRVEPTPLDSPYFMHCNAQAAHLLGLDVGQVSNDAALRCFNGDELLPGMQPVATAYAGHQFGIFTSRLGDGRAITLGQTQRANGETYEVQLKGAGLTPYSRTLDGRYPLGAAVREYLAGEALTALGILSTRALCLLGSQTEIRRQEHSETAAILVRMAKSHMRFGHFEYFHHRDDIDELRELFVFVTEQYFPELLNEAAEQWPLRFLEIVIERTARLIAGWQSVGFVHGVMNTDNMTLSGETLDLGPCGFMEAYDPGFSPNPGDDQQRYQYDQQPDIGRWNCLALAQAFTSLLPSPTIPACLLRLYRQTYQQHYLQAMRTKLGLQTPHPGDVDLVHSLLSALARSNADYAGFFRDLARLEPHRGLFARTEFPVPLQNWLGSYQDRLRLEKSSPDQRRERMNRVNPCYVLRRHLLDQAIQSAEQGDFTELGKLLELVQNPYEERPGMDFYSQAQPEASFPTVQSL
ncbi:protein adenylyltransferase SelO [Methylobacter sp. YRD-M1]|uniref:protein adenylyltransferase SelO n=1 Tax=Methylobacter sp. YRD-M1 TaxID=2911520 RepID=UPI00227C9BB7|nr:YdiU family protein [Methylobacter sp. YRD-M1]WAK02952.1 YdiU family protein [Methylobacter sp. YRD-M1]